MHCKNRINALQSKLLNLSPKRGVMRTQHILVWCAAGKVWEPPHYHTTEGAQRLALLQQVSKGEADLCMSEQSIIKWILYEPPSASCQKVK